MLKQMLSYIVLEVFIVVKVAESIARWISCLVRIYCHAHACNYNWKLCASYSITRP
jgi:hypothetical protein